MNKPIVGFFATLYIAGQHWAIWALAGVFFLGIAAEFIAGYRASGK